LPIHPTARTVTRGPTAYRNASLLSALLCLIASVPPLEAQTTLTLDGAATRVAYDTGQTTSSWALSPALQLVRPWQSLVVNGTFAQFPGTAWSLQGNLAGSAFTQAVAGFRAELAGMAAGTRHQDGSTSSQYLGLLRVHRIGTRFGGWIGGGIGRAWNGIARNGVAVGEVAGWVDLGGGTLTATVSPTGIGDSLRYLDLIGTFRLDRGPLELVASAGWRNWRRPAGVSGTAWGGGSATFWLGRHVAAVASLGAYPADYAQGLPNGSYGAIGFRIATRRPGAPSQGVSPPVQTARFRALPPVARPLVPEFEVQRLSGDTLRLGLRAPGACRVEIMGDFTDWQPVALSRKDGQRWETTLVIPRGAHRLNLRVDGGPWGIPPGVTPLTDEFGGVVGILPVD
jgi:hypothetical protein